MTERNPLSMDNCDLEIITSITLAIKNQIETYQGRLKSEYCFMPEFYNREIESLKKALTTVELARWPGSPTTY